MCLNETYSAVCTRKIFVMFDIQNGLKQEALLSPLISYFALEYAIRRGKERTGKD
jgi:hypothetical protein